KTEQMGLATAGKCAPLAKVSDEARFGRAFSRRGNPCGPSGRGTFDGHAFNNSRQGECVPMPGKMAKSAPRPPFAPPVVPAGVPRSRLAYREGGRALIFTPVRESSGECRLNHNMMPMTMGTNDSAPLLSCSAG